MITAQIVALNYIVTGNFKGSEILTALLVGPFNVVCADKFNGPTHVCCNSLMVLSWTESLNAQMFANWLQLIPFVHNLECE